MTRAPRKDKSKRAPYDPNDPFFPVQLRTSHWKIVLDALEQIKHPTDGLVDAYMRISAYLERKGEK